MSEQCDGRAHCLFAVVLKSQIWTVYTFSFFQYNLFGNIVVELVQFSHSGMCTGKHDVDVEIAELVILEIFTFAG
jgi:hypothetical protein